VAVHTRACGLLWSMRDRPSRPSTARGETAVADPVDAQGAAGSDPSTSDPWPGLGALGVRRRSPTSSRRPFTRTFPSESCASRTLPSERKASGSNDLQGRAGQEPPKHQSRARARARLGVSRKGATARRRRAIVCSAGSFDAGFAGSNTKREAGTPSREPAARLTRPSPTWRRLRVLDSSSLRAVSRETFQTHDAPPGQPVAPSCSPPNRARARARARARLWYFRV
jgi:hypothetical protein